MRHRYTMRIQIKIKGVKEYRRAMRAGPDLVKRGIRRAMEAAMNLIRRKQKYPAPPAGSTYVRTGTLGRQLTHEVRQIGSKTVGILGSPTVYAPFVIGEDQASVHRGRWWTILGLITKNAREITSLFERMMRRVNAEIERLAKS